MKFAPLVTFARRIPRISFSSTVLWVTTAPTVPPLVTSILVLLAASTTRLMGALWPTVCWHPLDISPKVLATKTQLVSVTSATIVHWEQRRALRCVLVTIARLEVPATLEWSVRSVRVSRCYALGVCIVVTTPVLSLASVCKDTIVCG